MRISMLLSLVVPLSVLCPGHAADSAAIETGGSLYDAVCRNTGDLRKMDRQYRQIRTGIDRLVASRKAESIATAKQSDLQLAGFIVMQNSVHASLYAAAQQTDSLLSTCRLSASQANTQYNRIVLIAVAGFVFLTGLISAGWLHLVVRQNNRPDRCARAGKTRRAGTTGTIFGPGTTAPPALQSVSPPADHDHTLACALGRELFRLRTKMQVSPDNGFSAALKRLEDELSSRGYTVRDLTGQPYHDGMHVSVVNFTPSERLRPGEERIDRTLRPAICFRGRTIEAGSVEVVIPASPRTSIPRQRSVA